MVSEQSEMMEKARSHKCASSLHKVLVVLLIVCFVQCATEQIINNRGSKPSNLIEKINGWRSQRGGSCLSYGHSCWGAHGKRSGQGVMNAPDWYLTRMLRRMADNDNIMNHAKPEPVKNTDLSAIFQTDVDETPSTDKLIENDGPLELPFSKNMMEAKPMLDDNLLSKFKMWQMLRDSAIEN